MLKRIFATILLACFALPATALAAPAFTPEDYVTLAELREQAASGWQQAYTAKGRDIEVKAASIQMPAADKCPVTRIEPWGEKDAKEGALSHFQSPALGREKLSDFGLSVRIDDESIWDREGYHGHVVTPESFKLLHGEIPSVQPDKLDLTYSEFLERINRHLALVSDFTVDDFTPYELWMEGPSYKAKEKNGEMVLGDPIVSSGHYYLWANQLFHGIPALSMLNSVYPGMPLTQLKYGYYTENCYSFALSPSKEISVLEEDVPLLSFPAFQRVLEAQIDSGHLRGVDNLEFGYIPCYQGSKSNRTWVLMPVWRIEGGYTRDPNTEKHVMPYYDPRDTDGSLTVPMTYGEAYYSAQTGEMLPCYLAVGDSANVFPAGDILTWDAVR